ncbi:MAG: nucleotidyltransferase domain-containing protein [Chloroflexi bacterium]|nr:nucleotidyltransferase domain-containing protein [Chloroflexota bacterium]
MLLRRVETLDDELLRELVQRVVRAVDAQRIVLFGSYAHGEPRHDSDIDLLVIAASDQPRWRRAIPVYDALRGLIVPKDVRVFTPEEVEEWSDVPGAFVTSVLREGRVLYEVVAGADIVRLGLEDAHAPPATREGALQRGEDGRLAHARPRAGHDEARSHGQPRRA